MQNLDVPKVIEAAATSNLGVLSLIVLVLAFLAWRFFQGSGDKVKLAAFGLMFLGALGFGASVMMAGPAAAPNAVASPTPEATTGAPAPAPEPQPDRALATAEAPANTREIAGGWHDAEGYRYAFEQTGAAFRYTSTQDGERASSGEGTLTGDRLAYKYRNEATADTGTCTGRLVDNGKAIEGKCGNGTDQWGFRIERDAKQGGAKD